MEFFAHLVLVLLTIFIIYHASPGSSLFSWHPTCMILATFLWTQGIISFRKPNPSLRVNVHWAMNATAITLAISGFLSIYRNKEADGKWHFTTWHGRAGLLSMILLLVQTVGGNFANFSTTIRKVVPAIKPAIIKYYHRLSGAAAITCVYLTVNAALCSYWFNGIVTHMLIWWGIVAALYYPYLYAVFYANFEKPPKQQQGQGQGKQKSQD